MTLSVIICTYNRLEDLKRVLMSIKAQMESVDEVVLVVGEDVEKVEKLTIFFKKQINIKVVKDPMDGLAKARDVGWRESKGELVAWIDDDVVLHKNWVKFVKARFMEIENIGGVSGPTIIPEDLLSKRVVFWWYPYYKTRSTKHEIRNLKESLKSMLARLWVWWMLDNDPYLIGRITKHWWWSPGSNFKGCLDMKGVIEVDYLEACNMILRRNLVEEVGGFDLSFRGTSEWCEVDLAMKVKYLGYKLIFDPKVKLEHRVSKEGIYSARSNLVERIFNYGRFVWIRQIIK